MSETTCPNCHHTFDLAEIPAEPPIGTWVIDRYGSRHQRNSEGWGAPGFFYTGRWRAMWEMRGPLVVTLPAPTPDDAEGKG